MKNAVGQKRIFPGKVLIKNQDGSKWKNGEYNYDAAYLDQYSEIEPLAD